MQLQPDRHLDDAIGKIASMKGRQFYLALDSARKAHLLSDFAFQIEANEPVLRIDPKLRSWNVGSTVNLSSRYDRLQMYSGPLSTQLLEPYIQSARHRPVTSLVKVGLHYVELGLPYVGPFPSQRFRTDNPQSHIVELSLKTNGVIANTMAAARTSSMNHSRFIPESRRVFLSPVGNALSLLAHEWRLLAELEAIIGTYRGFIPATAALAVYIALVCRHSQLLDHACYRALDGRKCF